MSEANLERQTNRVRVAQERLANDVARLSLIGKELGGRATKATVLGLLGAGALVVGVLALKAYAQKRTFRIQIVSARRSLASSIGRTAGRLVLLAGTRWGSNYLTQRLNALPEPDGDDDSASARPKEPTTT